MWGEFPRIYTKTSPSSTLKSLLSVIICHTEKWKALSAKVIIGKIRYYHSHSHAWTLIVTCSYISVPFSLLWHLLPNSVLTQNPSSLHSQLEVFNILFIREQEKRHVVHCMGCARKQQPTLQGFVCLEEYKLSELVQVYDSFVLHKPPPPIAVPAPNAATGSTPTTPSTTGAPQSTTTSTTTSPTVTTSASTTSVTN